jgi:hypothetical protein
VEVEASLQATVYKIHSFTLIPNGNRPEGLIRQRKKKKEKQRNGRWRKLHTDDIHSCTLYLIMLGQTKMRWACHIACMEETRKSHPLGRTRLRWETDNITIDLREIWCESVDLKDFYQHDNMYLRVTETVRNFLRSEILLIFVFFSLFFQTPVLTSSIPFLQLSSLYKQVCGEWKSSLQRRNWVFNCWQEGSKRYGMSPGSRNL